MGYQARKPTQDLLASASLRRRLPLIDIYQTLPTPNDSCRVQLASRNPGLTEL